MADDTTDRSLPPIYADDSPDIREAVQRRYTAVAERGSCCGPAASSCCDSDTAAGRLYSAEELAAITDEAAAAAAGCGNPTAFAELRPGETVLDLGSGGGIDCFLAAKQVGPEGRVIGIDMTVAMVDLARQNAAKLEAHNVVFKLAQIEALPEPDGTVDAIISNCVVNLAPDKQQVFNEAFRVLAPGGRLYVSDIVLTRELPPEVAGDWDQWAGCIAGAQLKDVYLGEIREAGFTDIDVISDVPAAIGSGDGSPGAVRSISVRAVKPAG